MPSAEKRGILLIDKDPGISSFSVISRLRKMLGLKRLGHCGTLDPFATGLLPVLIGRSTGAVQFMEHYDKTYEVLAVPGASTDTCDREGEVTAEADASAAEKLVCPELLLPELKAAAERLSGENEQMPPLYSAIKVKGRALYEYARKGIPVEVKKRRVVVRVMELECIDRSAAEALCLRTGEPPLPENRRIFLRAVLHVSKGTYIRSWIHDLGQETGCLAYCHSLRRLSCGPFAADGARTTQDYFDIFHSLKDDREAFWKRLQEEHRILPVETAFPDLPRIDLEQEESVRLLHGQPLMFDEAALAAKTMEPNPEAPVYLQSSVLRSSLEDNERRALAFYGGLCLAMVKLREEENGLREMKTERVWASHDDLS